MRWKRAENLFATQNTALAPVDALSAPTQHCGKTGKHLDFWLESCRDQTDELMGRVTSVSLSWAQVRGLTGSGEDLEGGWSERRCWY
ncbi:hypothetical protein HBI26_006330 [Parastagonospora nodorum]|nr:hypothetical protein HBH51_172350 [Parastagonospora nodorum]KAH4265116.1 hypothetical protein HBI03_079980 [Parastagonospora nodorum]KAH4283083.1 hypothetical protein HBI04_018370 [Parastagonospora nodorum]KAH4943307.1 hypothetical protein HBI79_016460 [Parastagonospora nodorum]KAH5322445.1 hypothetical protein HBI12_094710 [Parastagonospora nodorum]